MSLLSRRTTALGLCSLLGMMARREGGGSAVQLNSSPAYCSKNMSWNEIPKLALSVNSSFNGSVAMDDVAMLQVQAIIRHGARTPLSKPRCWAGYNFTWDCSVTEVVASSPRYERNASISSLFRKRYDAYPTKNALGGTCALGQLVDEGYDQEKENGLHLRKSYVCSEGPWCLFANDSAEDLQADGALYLRSDDEPRTVMSGQIVASIMLNVSNSVLDWHTGDDDFDYLEANEKVCPRLQELSEEAFAAKNWTDRLASTEHQVMNDSMHAVWDNPIVWWTVLDCLMTTACSDRELPAGMTEALFEQAIEFATAKEVYQSAFNDAAFGKLSMTRLTSDIRRYFQGAIDGTSTVKFVLFSGHDSTFIPLLTAMAPEALHGEWPPYASLATIELLRIGGAAVGKETNATEDYFRMVYNGQVIRLKGCHQDVCAVSLFLEATQFAVDLADDDHCALTGGTASQPSSSSPSDNLVPSPMRNISATSSPQPHSEDEIRGSMPSSEADNNSDGDDRNGFSRVWLMVSSFLMGAIVVSAPAFLSLRRFRYEAVHSVGPGRTEGHSYEMT